MVATTTAVLLCLALSAVEPAKLPSEIVQCRRGDPDINKCLQDAISRSVINMKNGIKSAHVLPIDPVAVSRIHIKQGSGPVSLNLDLSNVQVEGFTKHRFHFVKADLDKRTIHFGGLFDALEFKSDYVMDGRFLVLPVKGSGKVDSTLVGAKVDLKIVASPVTKDGGEVYWQVDDFHVAVPEVQQLKVNFQNLFNGDKALGDATNKVLNDNWQEFWAELRPAMEETFSAVAKNVANAIFSRVPEKDLFL